ncbi:MAG: HlyD family type I secretion periplasmic adaptor subunit [Lentisphaeria bacterium]|nr:HlyD family type I secretion periplasmic adaptor subunit [Lentisphaeria bacterium]
MKIFSFLIAPWKKFQKFMNWEASSIPDEAIEFQPDALEIANSRLPIWARYSVVLAFIFLAGALLWATLGKVDVIVTGNGKIVSDKQTIVMKPLELTVIKEVNVKLGEVVKPNQILITFDPTINIAEAERLQLEVESLSAKFSRLQAEFNNTDYKASSNKRFPQLQEAIYKQRKDYYRERLSYFDETLKQIDASRKTREDSMNNQRKRLKEIQTLENTFDAMYKQTVTTLKEYVELKLSRMQMEATIDELENALLELQHQRGSTLSSRNSFIEEWRNSISEQLVETERELSANQRQYEKNQLRVDSLYLRAPCEAVVHEIAAFSTGSAVREAEALITLIPLDGHAELEAEIRPQDIAKVQIGSEVRIKLSAYPFQKYDTLNGIVRNISEDTFTMQGRADIGQSQTYYRARITVNGKLRNQPEKFRLIPGMEATAEIKTGRRRIIEYLIYPLIKALDETAREP